MQVDVEKSQATAIMIGSLSSRYVMKEFIICVLSVVE